MRWVAVLLLGCLVVAACSREPGIPKAAARPPVTRVAPVTDMLHGVAIVDNFRWLEGDNADPGAMGKPTAEVAAWTGEQNTYARNVLDHLPGRAELEARFKPLMRTGSVAAPIVRGNRYFFARGTAAEAQPIIYLRQGYLGADRMLVDPADLDTTGRTAVMWCAPSEDGKLLAYGTLRAGDSGPTLHVLDVDTAKRLPLEIPNVPAAVDWLPDGSGFFYQRVDPTGREGLFHRMGGQPGADVQLYRQATPPNAENLPPTWGPFGSVSRDGHWFVLGFGRDAVSNDLWLANFDEFRKTGRLAGAVVSVGTPGQASGTVVDGTLFLRTTKGAPRGRVIAVRAGDPAESRWRDVVAERPDAVIEDVSFGRGRIAVTYRKNAADVVEIFDTAGKPVATLAQPGLGVSSLTAQEDRTEAFLTFTSFNYPPTVFRVDLADPAGAPILWMAPEAAVDPTSVQVEQVWYPSKDGTRISMFLVHKSSSRHTGDTPALLVGYGGFGVSMTPTFSATFFQWFEAGGLLAVPNVRGGGEYGDAWHAAGMLDRKQHAFDDFIAAAEWLAANKYTNPQRLALYGGGHGALLTAAVLTQRPDLFRAAVGRLPVLDMLRYQHFLAGRSWAPEYGSADHPEQFKWLLAYSPYQRVQAGTKYPGVLLTVAEDDPEIHPMHARKMVAALRAATASDPADHPILLRVDPSGRQDPGVELRDLVDQRLFIMWQLGMR